MPRKSRRLPRNRKSAGANSSGNRIAKDEKAKYERRRRRRWGIIKKAKEYHALFDEEVYLLIKDEHKAQYFSTAEGWISSPQQIGAVRVYAPGSCRSTTGHKSTGLDESSDSDGESAIPDFDFESGHDSISFQPPQHEGEGYCSTEAVQGGYNSFIACLYRLQGAFEAVGEVIETGGAESSIEDVVGSG